MAMIPLLVARIVRDDVGDLEYIQGFVESSNYFQESGNINTLNDTIEFIVPSGKRAFMIEAKIVPTAHSNPPQLPLSTANTIINNRVQAQFKIGGTVKDTANVGMVHNATAVVTEDAGAGTGAGSQLESRFNVLGLSLIGNGALKIEIENTLDNGTAFATMSGYLIDT